MEKKILKFGYEYTLVHIGERAGCSPWLQPAAFGFQGYVLKSYKKLNK